MFKLVSAGLAEPHVPNTALRPMLRPFWRNDSGTALRTLRDRPFTHGDPSLSPTPMEACYSQNQAGLSDYHQLLLQHMSEWCGILRLRNRSAIAEALVGNSFTPQGVPSP